jgi:WhiB family redox-sensing transcriptional regulator
MTEEWRQWAACRDHPTWWWFAGVHHQHKSAKRAQAICEVCPVRTACLEHALARPEDYGLWGGVDEQQRHRIRARRIRVQWGDR